jgi:hypothetical protein
LSGGIMLSSRRTGWLVFAALTGAVLSVVAHAAQSADERLPPDAAITAIWKVEQIDFVYSSSTVRYSCESLRWRIAAILQTVGAHSRMAIELSCANGERVNHANARIKLATPVEASEENVRAATDYDSRDELVARLQHKELAGAEDIQRFAATWRTVALTRKPPLSLGPGDCDLLRAMRDQVFPRLRVRVVSSGLNCGSGPDTRITPRIQVNALMPSRT